MPATKFPLRSKRKAETRCKLIRAARELFLKKGYDETTLEEIADAAGLHVQTLYRHFATKQDLAVAGDIKWLDIFREDIKAASGKQNTFEFWRDWMDAMTDHLTRDGGDRYRRHLRIRHASPTLLGTSRQIQSEYEDLLANSLAHDFQVENKGVCLPRLVAGMLMAGNGYVLRQFDLGEADLKAETLQVIDQVYAQYADQIVTQVEAAPKIAVGAR